MHFQRKSTMGSHSLTLFLKKINNIVENIIICIMIYCFRAGPKVKSGPVGPVHGICVWFWHTNLDPNGRDCRFIKQGPVGNDWGSPREEGKLRDRSSPLRWIQRNWWAPWGLLGFLFEFFCVQISRCVYGILLNFTKFIM